MRKTTHTPLRNIRRARTLSQAQLAELLGVSQQTYCKYERGTLTPSADMQERLAAILGSAVHVLFPTTDEAVAS